MTLQTLDEQRTLQAAVAVTRAKQFWRQCGHHPLRLTSWCARPARAFLSGVSSGWFSGS
jgi:hypothetical protein